MEKEMKKNTYILETSEKIGTVKIADDVVAMIAGIATTEIEGVSAMAGNITNELMSKAGIRNFSKGVKVDVLEKLVTVDVTITIVYGYSIPVICGKIQEKVKASIENMTGLSVADVNIRIAGVIMPKEK